MPGAGLWSAVGRILFDTFSPAECSSLVHHQRAPIVRTDAETRWRPNRHALPPSRPLPELRGGAWFSSTIGALRPTSLSAITTVRVMTGRPADSATGIQVTAAIVPGHYASEEQIARALARLGKPAAAKLITDLLPQTPQIRSGDLGEIYATEWIDAHSGGYRAPIKRLRWKDHRNMAMRGDDVIGMILDPATQRLHFLKTEAKSRIDAHAPRPSPKPGPAWTRMAACRPPMRCPSSRPGCWSWARPAACRRDRRCALSSTASRPQNVRHLLFTFSGNAPDALLTQALQAYPDRSDQWGIGLHVEGHAAFIGAVYDRVIADANNA